MKSLSQSVCEVLYDVMHRPTEQVMFVTTIQDSSDEPLWTGVVRGHVQSFTVDKNIITYDIATSYGRVFRSIAEDQVKACNSDDEFYAYCRLQGFIQIPTEDQVLVAEAAYESFCNINDTVQFTPMMRHCKALCIEPTDIRFGKIVSIRFTEAKVFYSVLDSYYGLIFDDIDSANIFTEKVIPKLEE